MRTFIFREEHVPLSSCRDLPPTSRFFNVYVFKKWNIVAELRTSKGSSSILVFRWFFASIFSGGIREYKIHICHLGHSLLPMKLFPLDTNGCHLGSKAKKNGISTRTRDFQI